MAFLLSLLLRARLGEHPSCSHHEQSSRPGVDMSPGDKARKMACRWFEGSHCLLKGHWVAPKQAPLVSVAISVLQALLHVTQSTLRRRSEATSFFALFDAMDLKLEMSR